MKPLRILETSGGAMSLLLSAGTTAADDAIAATGHEPNGYFWEGVARRLLDGELAHLVGGPSAGR